MLGMQRKQSRQLKPYSHMFGIECRMSDEVGKSRIPAVPKTLCRFFILQGLSL
jgi:hypothetical protein